MCANFDEFPAELSTPQLAFVALTGLDIIHNAIHRAIWDLLSNNRQADRVPIYFRVLEGDHEYPKPKTKRTSYERYVPKGILKINWMKKHLYEIPALVVVFFDLDWDESAWNEKLMELCAKVQVVRSALTGRNTRVAVVLIQKNSPLPPGEDLIASDRATALCTACELTPKLLYVFPHTDHLFGYAIRLENAFYELSQSYYQNEGKIVKTHREYLNRTTHQLLIVRHQFKIAFYNELKHDFPTALKHYKQAYMSLMEVRTSDMNIAEVKMVAGFINYKICKLSFYLNTPVDAISQFRQHIDIFKNRIGNSELAFEHSAWMAKQFSAFADLFEEAVKAGLSAIQTQHPGFYYQQAAIHAKMRKSLCHRLCQNTSYPQSNPLADWNCLEYYGQRSWRQGVQSMEIQDPALEQDGIRALQHREATEINHAMLVVPLLSNAIAQFKKYRCPRMKRYLVVQMGEEYYDAEDYSKALALLCHVLWDYRQERWWDLLTNILKITLKCAYLIASVQEYVTISLELISPYVRVDLLIKQQVQQNIMSVLMNETPSPEPDLTVEAVQTAQQLWEKENSTINSPLVFSIDVNHIASFVKIKALFIDSSVCLDCPVALNVFLRVCCPLPLRIMKLCVTFSNQIYNEQCIISDSKAQAYLQNGYVADLLLEPGKTKVVPFSFFASHTDANQTIEISSVILQLGDEQNRCAILHWKDIAHEIQYPLNSFLSHLTTSSSESDVQTLDVRNGHRTIRILPRESRLKLIIEHEAPAHIKEFYPIKLILLNQESIDIRKVTVEVDIAEKHCAYLSIDKPTKEKLTSEPSKLIIGDLPVGQKLEKLVFLNVPEEMNCIVMVKVEYKLNLDISGQNYVFVCANEENIIIPVVQPFCFTIKALSTKMESLDSLWFEEPFLLHIEVQSSSPWPLSLKTSRLKSNRLKCDGFISQIENITLNSNDCVCECHYFEPPTLDEGLLEIGTYFLSWKRKFSDELIPFVDVLVQLPSLVVIRIPISVSLDMPTHGWVRTPMTVSYSVQNKTSQVQEFDFCMDSSDSFMYAGHKQVHFKILPKDSLVLRYNLYPLVSGNVPVPNLRLLTHDSVYDSQIEGIIQKLLPSHIFIMPQAKRWPASEQ